MYKDFDSLQIKYILELLTAFFFNDFFRSGINVNSISVNSIVKIFLPKCS